MRYFKLNTLGDTRDPSLAFVDQEPEDLDGWGYCLAKGERMGARYPPDARTYLQPESPGLKLGGLIGNSCTYLIVTTPLKDVLLAQANVALECLPLAVYNHRRRLHSDECWVINPIGTLDCLDHAASQIVRGEETGEIILIERYAFRRAGLAAAPSILRVKETPWEYFIDLATARAIHQARCSNVYVQEVPCT